MAVKPTPNNSLYKGFTFDGIDSRDYGVYISGDAVFDSPERDVEMIEIPGRNGSFAMDKGRFGNITVSYPAGLFGDDEASFREGIRALRNALASRKGYCRLEDDYNPNEYRMAVYKKGLEVDPALLKAGEFTIEFDCMPQRWLKSGETAVSVASGGTLNNPTLFEAHPLLQVWGYGDIRINGEALRINSVAIGTIAVSYSRTTPEVTTNSQSGYNNVYTTIELSFNGDTFNSGDLFTIGNLSAVVSFQSGQGYTITDVSTPWQYYGGTTQTAAIKMVRGDITFTRGTSIGWSSGGDSSVITADNEGDAVSANVGIQMTVSYDGDSTITIEVRARTETTDAWIHAFNSAASISPIVSIVGVSTKSALGEPLYFDLDIGEAYKIEDEQTISVNNAVTIPAKLPVLKSGTNTITYDNTVTQFQVVPRWWEV